MRPGIRIGLLGLSLVLLGSCGGGGGGGGGFSGPAGLKLEQFDIGIIEPARLDQPIMFVFDGPVNENKIGPETIRIRAGNEIAEGTWFRGIVLFDPDSGTDVVVDPEELGDERLAEVEKKGDLELVPPQLRYDLGNESHLNGARQVLLDRSVRRAVCFQPKLPVLPDFSDAGLRPGTTYTVEIAGHRKVRTFTTVAANDPQPFLGMENANQTRLVNSDPANGMNHTAADSRLLLRFSQPLDPRTVTPENFTLELVSVAGRPQIEVTLELRQSYFGLVEVVMTPQHDLPLGFYEVTISSGVTDLAGRPVPPATLFSFSTDNEFHFMPFLESFDTESRKDEANTTADWNTTLGALQAAPGPAESVGQSLWYNQFFPTPDYGDITVDLDTNGGTVEIFVQGAREDVSLPGSQPIDPDTDPERLFSTDWVPAAEIDRLDNFQFLRFRVVFRPAAGSPVPMVREILIPVNS